VFPLARDSGDLVKIRRPQPRLLRVLQIAAIRAHAHGAPKPGGIRWVPEPSTHAQGSSMNSIIYIVGLVVVVGFLLRFFGLV